MKLSYLQNSRTDIAFADLYLIPSRKEHIDYVYPHDTDYVCFLVAKPPLSPKWKDLAVPFQTESWIAIVVTLVIAMVAAKVISALNLREDANLSSYPLNVFAMFMDESVPFTHVIKSDSLRIMIGVLGIMVYILTLSYKGSLNAVLTVTFFPKPMDTLQEIAKQDLPIGSFSDTFQKAVELSTDTNLQKIADKYYTHYDFDLAFENATGRKVVMAESKQFLQYNLRKRFTNQ